MLTVSGGSRWVGLGDWIVALQSHRHCDTTFKARVLNTSCVYLSEDKDCNTFTVSYELTTSCIILRTFVIVHQLTTGWMTSHGLRESPSSSLALSSFELNEGQPLHTKNYKCADRFRVYVTSLFPHLLKRWKSMQITIHPSNSHWRQKHSFQNNCMLPWDQDVYDATHWCSWEIGSSFRQNTTALVYWHYQTQPKNCNFIVLLKTN